MASGIRLNACQWVAACLGGALALTLVLYPPWLCRIRAPYVLHPAIEGIFPPDSPTVSCEKETVVHSWVFRPPDPSPGRQSTASIHWPVLSFRLILVFGATLLAIGFLADKGPVLRLLARLRGESNAP
ncbi:MAG: hypothetical protein FJ291_12610 [Planctomycetes bacterium]|nr:hypothetical protein [Planctomycetota bacterium]